MELEQKLTVFSTNNLFFSLHEGTVTPRSLSLSATVSVTLYCNVTDTVTTWFEMFDCFFVMPSNHMMFECVYTIDNTTASVLHAQTKPTMARCHQRLQRLCGSGS
jgi:hypothetical protein